MAQPDTREKINLLPQNSSGGSRGPRNPRTASFADDFADDFDDSRKRVFDENGKLVGYDDGKHFERIEQNLSLFAQETGLAEYLDVMQTITQVAQATARARVNLQELERQANRDINRHALVPAAHIAIADWHTSGRTRNAARVSQVQLGGLFAGVEQAMAGKMALAVSASVERTYRSLNSGFDVDDYNRDRVRLERGTRFGVEIAQTPQRESYAHAIKLLETEMEYKLAGARLDVELRAAERADAASEADKNRAQAMNAKTLDLGKQLYDTLVELRLAEQTMPTEKIVAAMAVIEKAMETFGKLYETQDEKSRTALQPTVQKVTLAAIEEAMKAIRRG